MSGSLPIPGFVPTIAQTFFSDEIEKLLPVIDHARQELTNLEHKLSNWSGLCEFCQLKNDPKDLHRRRAIVIRNRDYLVGRMNYILRLAAVGPDDQRMQEAYNALRREFTTDGQWIRFIHAACSSLQDYTEYRERKRRAAELIKQVADAADALSLSLSQLRETGVQLPIELMSHGRRWWSHPGTNGIELELLIRDMCLAVSSPRHPDLASLSVRAAKAARTVSLSFGTSWGAVDAAISKRKPNLKTEYLRAFGNLLTKDNRSVGGEPITLTPGVRRAMATTCTVAINSEVIVVTEDDVRKALDVSEQSRVKKHANLPRQRKICRR